MTSPDIPQGRIARIAGGGLALAVIAVGVVARLRLYRSDGLLTFDESLLRLALQGWSPAHWLAPLGFEQTAAPLFLGLLHPLAASTASDERLLRLLPLAASLLLLSVFYWAVQVLWSRRIALIATALLAFHSTLVGYAAIFKQYEVDALAAAFVLALAALITRRPDRPLTWVIVLLAGCVAVVLSQPAIVALFALLTWIVLDPGPAAKGAARARLISRVVACGLAWVALEATLYFVLYAPVASSPYMATFWSGSYLRLSELGGWTRAGYALFGSFPGGAVIAGLLAGAGVVRMLTRTDWRLVLTGGPLLMAVTMALLHTYPVAPRLWLFLAPSAAVVVAIGAEAVWVGMVRLLGTPVPAAAFAVLSIAAAFTLHRMWGWPSADSVSYVLHRAGGQHPPITAEIERRAARQVLAGNQCHPVYVAARGMPKWYFFSNEDQGGVARFGLMRANMSRSSASFGDAPPSSVHLPDPGDALRLHVGCHDEVYGLASGTPYRPDHPAEARVPVAGWAANEIDRLVAQPDDFYLYLDGAGDFESAALLGELDRRHVRYAAVEPGVSVYRVTR